MNLNVAIETHSRFHAQRFIPALERALEDGKMDSELATALEEAIRISKSPGPPAAYGNAMINEIVLVLLFESMPRAKKRR